MDALTSFSKFGGRGYCWCKNPPDHKNLSTPPCEPLCSIQYGGISMQRHWYQWWCQEKIRSLNLIFDVTSTEIPLMRRVSSMISRQCQQHLSQWNTPINWLIARQSACRPREVWLYSCGHRAWSEPPLHQATNPASCKILILKRKALVEIKLNLKIINYKDCFDAFFIVKFTVIKNFLKNGVTRTFFRTPI